MEQIGIVERIEGKQAVVTVARASACGENCAHCKGGCTPTKVQAWVENGAGAKPGDLVKLETSTAQVVRASLILYFVPCLFAIFGAVAASNLFHSTAVAAVCAGTAFFACFAVIKLFDKKIAPVSNITKIIKRVDGR